MAEIKNIHDHFFKRFFSDVANVRELLNLVLPTEVREQLDLSIISLEPTSYVSEEYRASLSDLVIKTRTKRKKTPVDIYFLFEHKSYPDRRAPIQLLRYMYLEWRQDHEKKRPFRVIIPVVFYHGRRPWNIPTHFMDQFDLAPEELKPFMLNFRYILFDTNRWNWKKASSAVAKENVVALTAVLLMMAASRHDLNIVRRVLQLWQEMGIIKEKELFTFIMIYIVETQDVSLSKIEKILEETHIEGEEIMPTLAQRLREEGYKAGIQQGIQEGIQKGIQEGIQKGRKEGLEKGKQEALVLLISTRFGITREEKDFVYNVKDISRLDQALKLILVANSKEEVLNLLKGEQEKL